MLGNNPYNSIFGWPYQLSTWLRVIDPYRNGNLISLEFLVEVASGFKSLSLLLNTWYKTNPTATMELSTARTNLPSLYFPGLLLQGSYLCCLCLQDFHSLLCTVCPTKFSCFLLSKFSDRFGYLCKFLIQLHVTPMVPRKPLTSVRFLGIGQFRIFMTIP